jgi:hypothetical protein
MDAQSGTLYLAQNGHALWLKTTTLDDAWLKQVNGISRYRDRELAHEVHSVLPKLILRL